MFACVHTLRVESPDYRVRDVQQGYESRHVAGAVWMYGIMAYVASEKNVIQAALDASLAFSLNPMPISEVRRRRLGIR